MENRTPKESPSLLAVGTVAKGSPHAAVTCDDSRLHGLRSSTQKRTGDLYPETSATAIAATRSAAREPPDFDP